MIEPFAINLTVEGRMPAISTIVNIMNPVNHACISVIGLWDTGATYCHISRRLYDKLDLKFTKKSVSHGHMGSMDTIYGETLVQFCCDAHIFVLNAIVMENLPGENIDFINGMDFILRGEFHLAYIDGKTRFSFRYPALKAVDCINDDDYPQPKFSESFP